jgi:hypothetical protein
MSAINVFDGFRETGLSVAGAVLPLVFLFLVFQALLLRLPGSYVWTSLKGTFLAGCGLLLFLQGVHIGLLPFGRAIGETLGATPGRWVLIVSGFLLGFLTTWGEPSVRILTDQIEQASGGSIRKATVLYAVSVGVGLSVSLGMLRITHAIPLLYLMVPGYVLVIVMIWFSEPEFVSIAVDSGGVATGPMANTFLLSLALGVSSSIAPQDLMIHGLGMVALIALAPIISVIVLGFIFRARAQKKE